MSPELRIQVPEPCAFLYQPARYKVMYGGRGGVKSTGMADALIVHGYKDPLRIMCARETMISLADSVHQLLCDRIEAANMGAYFTIEKAHIYGHNGTAFSFAGLRNDINSIKSAEGIDRLWVEEAATVSKHSWDVVIPTIRKPDSEIWVSFNPELETDDTYQRFVVNPPPNCRAVYTTYRDNPFFPDVLRVEMEHCRATSIEDYEHIWLGQCRKGVSGAILGEQLKQADADGRITSVPYDRTKPVETFWDLGFGDLNAIWFVQRLGGWYNLIDYEEASGRTIADWVIELQQKRYVYKTMWLPHDGVDALLHRKLTGDRSKSPEMLLREAGYQVRIAPKYEVNQRINQARTILPQCRFDRERCADGLQGLRHYQWAPPSTVRTEAGTNEKILKREPLHNWASHPSDAFCTLAVAAQFPAEEKYMPRRQQETVEYSSWA